MRFSKATFLALSLAGWTTYLVLQPRAHPYGDLSRGWYSDHFSHLNAARALLFGGVNLWRTSLAQALRPLTAQERASLPEDLLRTAAGPNGSPYALPGAPAGKPILASWSELPRPYPPGDVLAVLPIALLYQWTDISFSTACHLLIWLFLLYAHLGLLFYIRSAFELPPAALVAVVLTYFEAVHWALEGFYDVATLIPLSLCALAVSRRAWLWALLAYSGAAFLHYRAFFFVPWAVFFVVQLVRERAWRTWKWREWAGLVGIAIFSLASLITFALVSPSMSAFPLDNPISDRNLDLKWAVGFVALVFAGIGSLLYARAWIDAAIALWISIILISVRQAFPWHALLLLPWLVLRRPSSEIARTAIADQVRLALVIATAAIVFRNPLVPTWLVLLP